MDYQVSLKNVNVSPRKALLFSRGIKGKNAFHSLHALKFMPQKTAYYLKKMIDSALAIAEEKGADRKKLMIKVFRVDQAQVTKRIRIKPKGSADQSRKRRSHFTLVVGDADLEKKVKKAKDFGKNKSQPKAGRPQDEKIDKKGKKNGSKSKSN